MTSSAAPVVDVASASASTIGARVVEFLLVGGGTLVVFPTLWLLKRCLGFDTAELVVGFLTFHAAHVINDPHFSVTYLLFYRDVKRRALGDAWGPAQRARYVVAGFVVPAVLAIWAALGLARQSAYTLGLLIQLMFLLVGWHYVKQAFGVVTVLSARRGIRFSRWERMALLAHCFAAWAYAWAGRVDRGTEVEEKGVVYTTIAHGPLLERLTQGLFFASFAVVVVLLANKWRSERRLPVAPILSMLLTIWFWSVYTRLDPLMVYVIPALHSVQYLYFVWLMKRNQAREAERALSFGPSARLRLATLAALAVGLGLLEFHALPALLDSALVARHPRTLAELTLGATPYFAAIFAFVNIHHYFMDTVIWRRHNPDTRYLHA